LSLSSQKYGFGIRDPGSGKNLFGIPDPGVKKAPDLGSGSATLKKSFTNCPVCFICYEKLCLLVKTLRKIQRLLIFAKVKFSRIIFYCWSRESRLQQQTTSCFVDIPVSMVHLFGFRFLNKPVFTMQECRQIALRQPWPGIKKIKQKENRSS
jgi:hypothetical protein